jgi:hypothetical protein
VTESELLRDVLARVVYLREAIDLDDIETASIVAADLEDDLAAQLAERAA